MCKPDKSFLIIVQSWCPLGLNEQGILLPLRLRPSDRQFHKRVWLGDVICDRILLSHWQPNRQHEQHLIKSVMLSGWARYHWRGRDCRNPCRYITKNVAEKVLLLNKTTRIKDHHHWNKRYVSLTLWALMKLTVWAKRIFYFNNDGLFYVLSNSSYIPRPS